MRSLVMSIYLFMTALAAAIGEAFVCKSGLRSPSAHSAPATYVDHLFRVHIALSADPLLVWNYGSIAVLCAVAGLVFWILVRKLDAEEDKLNNLSHGRFEKEY